MNVRATLLATAVGVIGFVGIPVVADVIGDLNQGPTTVAERLVEDLQSGLGIKRETAAAIVGNIAMATGDFQLLEQVGTDDPDAPIGFGRWTGSKKADFIFLTGEGDTLSYKANADFLVTDLQLSHGDLLQRMDGPNLDIARVKIFQQEYFGVDDQEILKQAFTRTEQYLDGNFTDLSCDRDYRLHRDLGLGCFHGQAGAFEPLDHALPEEAAIAAVVSRGATAEEVVFIEFGREAEGLVADPFVMPQGEVLLDPFDGPGSQTIDFAFKQETIEFGDR